MRLGQGFVESEALLAPDTHERDDDRLHYQKIMQRVSALPEAQRNTVFLVYVEGFTYQEAADTLSVPIGTIMSRLAPHEVRWQNQLMLCALQRRNGLETHAFYAPLQ